MHKTRRFAVTLITLSALLGIPGFGKDPTPDALPPGKAATLSLTVPTWVGQRLLPAGSYQFRCVHKGGYHLMAIRQTHPAAPGGTETIGKQVATAYCRMEVLPNKVKMSSARTTKDASGGNVLDEVRIRGEFVRHIFGQVFLLEPAMEIEPTISYPDTVVIDPTGEVTRDQRNR